MDKLKENFCENLYRWYIDNFKGTQTAFGKFLNVSQGQVNKIFAKQRWGEEPWRRMVAEKIGMDYDEMIGIKKKKNQPGDQQNKPIPMDPAIKILHEALEETGVTINEKQKHAVLKIIREELAKMNSKSQDDIKNYLAVFGK